MSVYFARLILLPVRLIGGFSFFLELFEQLLRHSALQALHFLECLLGVLNEIWLTLNFLDIDRLRALLESDLA